jgi:hypothetical protein
MKKFMLSFAMVASLFAVNAQKGLEVGVFVQPQNTWIMNQEDFDAGSEIDFRPTFGVSSGLNVGFNFTDNIGIRSGFTFLSSQGMNYKSDVGAGYEPSVKMNYMKVPLMLKFNSDPSASTSFLFTAGVNLGFLTSAKSEGFPEANTIQGAVDLATLAFRAPNAFVIGNDDDLTDAYKGFDIQPQIGLGLQANLTNNLNLNFLFTAAYSLGDIEEESKKPGGRESSANHLLGGFQIGVNYVLFGE